MNPTRVLLLCLGGALCIAPSFAHADSPSHAKEQPLLQKDLQPGLDEGLMLTVDLAPGAASPAHRHNAQVFVYMLEGEVLMQVKGGPETRLKPGEVFYESPDDIHVQTRNLSSSAPARFVVFFVKKKGTPPVQPAQ
jgi:quercetin dioxygenase-like cupin family protein